MNLEKKNFNETRNKLNKRKYRSKIYSRFANNQKSPAEIPDGTYASAKWSGTTNVSTSTG